MIKRILNKDVLKNSIKWYKLLKRNKRTKMDRSEN